MSTAGAMREATETIPIKHDTYERVLRLVIFGAPPLALALAAWWWWDIVLRWQDLVVLAITYTLTRLCITVGYHRLFTHRSFKTGLVLRVLLAVLGSTPCVTASAADRSPPPISPATSPGWRRSPSAKPGTTTITPYPPRPVTAWAAASLIPAPG